MSRRISLKDLTPQALVDQEWGLADLKKDKPNNWPDYVQVFIDEARRTHATEIAYVGRGFESCGVYELFKDGKSLHALIRIQNGSLPMPANHCDGLLPFYSQEVLELPGDVHPDLSKPSNNEHPYGIRINVMPKVLRLPELANEMGPVNTHLPHWDELVHYQEKIRQQIDSRLAMQGQAAVDNHPGNEGFYYTEKKQYVPVVFDPGSAPMNNYPAAIAPGSPAERARMKNILRYYTKGDAAWMKPEIWKNMRREIADDAKRLYDGKPTHYARRMETVSAEVPIAALEATTRKVGVREVG